MHLKCGPAKQVINRARDTHLVGWEFRLDLESRHQPEEGALHHDADRRRPDLIGPPLSDEILLVHSVLEDGVKGEGDEMAPSLEAVRWVKPKSRGRGGGKKNDKLGKGPTPGRHSSIIYAGQAWNDQGTLIGLVKRPSFGQVNIDILSVVATNCDRYGDSIYRTGMNCVDLANQPSD